MNHEATLPADTKARLDGILDWLQMLSGACLILFMWAHLILVASIIIGPGAMNALAGFFEATYLAQVGGPLVALGFLVHFLLAARKVPFRAESARTIGRHARLLGHADTWLWLVQVVSGMVILLMGCIHMWVVLTDLPITAAKSAARIQGGWWLAFYLVLLPLVEAHVSVGFYRIGVKWGVVKRRSRKSAKRLEGGMAALFILIGLVTLARFWLLSF